MEASLICVNDANQSSIWKRRAQDGSEVLDQRVGNGRLGFFGTILEANVQSGWGRRIGLADLGAGLLVGNKLYLHMCMIYDMKGWTIR